jgi:hypothetical protein
MENDLTKVLNEMETLKNSFNQFFDNTEKILKETLITNNQLKERINHLENLLEHYEYPDPETN